MPRKLCSRSKICKLKQTNPYPDYALHSHGGNAMPKDAVQTLEATRQKLIKKLLDKKAAIEDQLDKLGYKADRQEPEHLRSRA
jgi:hypothetical protein